MSEIAKKYPMIGVIIGKQNRGIKLSDEEEKIHLTYFRECQTTMHYAHTFEDQKLLAIESLSKYAS